MRDQKGRFLSMLLGTLGASLLGDLLTKNLSGKGNVRAREGTVRAGERIKKNPINTSTSFNKFCNKILLQK